MSTQPAQLRDLTDQLAARDGVIARLKEHLGEIRNPLTSYVHGDNELTPADINGMLDETDTALSITSAAYADQLREAEATIKALLNEGEQKSGKIFAVMDERNALRAELTALRGLLARAEPLIAAHKANLCAERDARLALLATDREPCQDTVRLEAIADLAWKHGGDLEMGATWLDELNKPGTTLDAIRRWCDAAASANDGRARG